MNDALSQAVESLGKLSLM